MARPTDYKPEYAEQARKLCLLGFIDKQLADFFNVTEQTINNWKKKYPEFFESLKRGKEIADAEVVDSLFNRAKGFEYTEMEIKNEGGKKVKKLTKKRALPDPVSAIFLLKNRQPKLWRDKPDDSLSEQQPTPVKIIINTIDASENHDGGES